MTMYTVYLVERKPRFTQIHVTRKHGSNPGRETRTAWKQGIIEETRK
jgi:hypothetical protein